MPMSEEMKKSLDYIFNKDYTFQRVKIENRHKLRRKTLFSISLFGYTLTLTK